MVLCAVRSACGWLSGALRLWGGGGCRGAWGGRGRVGVGGGAVGGGALGRRGVGWLVGREVADVVVGVVLWVVGGLLWAVGLVGGWLSGVSRMWWWGCCRGSWAGRARPSG